MAVTVTYDPVLSRMRIVQTGGLTADLADFIRTTDGVNWTTVRGGGNVPLVGGTEANVSDYEFPAGVPITYRVEKKTSGGAGVAGTSATPITQELDAVWLKVPAAPFLNQRVDVADRSEVTRRSRSGLFDVVGRSNPVMVGDVASSIAYTLSLFTADGAEESNLDYVFASGEVVFLHLPSTVNYLQGGYFAVGDSSRVPVSMVSTTRRWTVPLTGVAAPGPGVVGSAYTWSSAIAEYATWSALIAGNATWAALLARTGSPSDVIVP